MGCLNGTLGVKDRSAPQQIDSFGGLHASPTKLALSKWLVDECVLAKASQSRRASMLAAPTWLITWKLRTWRCTPASTASWRAARMIESRAAIGPAHPVPTNRPVSAHSSHIRAKSNGFGASFACGQICGGVVMLVMEHDPETAKKRRRERNVATWGGNCSQEAKYARLLRSELEKCGIEAIVLNDYTVADIILRPLTILEDRWVPLQLKTTRAQRPTRSDCSVPLWRFSNMKGYHGMPILCAATSSSHRWLMVGQDWFANDIDIGSHKGKYAKLINRVDDS